MEARRIIAVAGAAVALMGASLLGAQATAPKKQPATKAAVTAHSKPTTTSAAPVKSTATSAKSADSAKKTAAVAHKKTRKPRKPA